jgi:hypothetical protein
MESAHSVTIERIKTSAPRFERLRIWRTARVAPDVGAISWPTRIRSGTSFARSTRRKQLIILLTTAISNAYVHGSGQLLRETPSNRLRGRYRPRIDSIQEAAQPIGRHLKVKTTSDALNQAKKGKRSLECPEMGYAEVIAKDYTKVIIGW